MEDERVTEREDRPRQRPGVERERRLCACVRLGVGACAFRGRGGRDGACGREAPNAG